MAKKTFVAVNVEPKKCSHLFLTGAAGDYTGRSATRVQDLSGKAKDFVVKKSVVNHDGSKMRIRMTGGGFAAVAVGGRKLDDGDTGQLQVTLDDNTMVNTDPGVVFVDDTDGCSE